MKRLEDIGLLYNGVRGLMYLEAFIRNDVIPGIVINHDKTQPDIYANCPEGFLDKYRKYFDHTKDLRYYESKLSVSVIRLGEMGINSEKFKETVLNRPERYFIFSGGGIIDKDLFGKDKEFIHIHPASLPDYRGSTCYYYNMLKEKQCVATAFFMNSRIDAGDVIMKKTFGVPCINEDEWMFFDLIFDPWIRSELLCDLIGVYKRKKIFKSQPQDVNKGNDYFVIHPVLKHIAIKNRINLGNVFPAQRAE